MILAYERSDGLNNIRLRYYNDLQSFKNKNFLSEVDIPRTLSATAEGTPSFESVQIGKGGLEKNSTIVIRFHFYEKGIHD